MAAVQRASHTTKFAKRLSFLGSPNARFFALVAFIALVAFTGGASRHDVASLIVLRPLAILFMAYALLTLTAEQLSSVRGPLLIVVSLLAVCALQLVPLPHAFWSGLPARDVIAELDSALGIGEIWRPLSLDPNRTWNTFFSLFVPLAAILLLALQPRENLRFVVPILFAVGLVGLLFGTLQMIGDRAFYLYEITNIDRPVGLFSNRNHQAVVFAWMIPAMVWAVLSLRRGHGVGGFTLIMCGILYLLLLTMISFAGSRAGLLLAVPGTALAAWLLLRSDAAARGKLAVVEKATRKILRIFAVVAGLLVIGLAAAVLTMGDNAALQRFFEDDAASGLRYDIFPTLIRMVADFFPFGSGFGSFDSVYRSFETEGDLSARYVNQAHNDVLQILIEGGLPAAVIVVAALAWLLKATLRAARADDPEKKVLGIFILVSAGIFLAASALDYPLRTPLAATMLAVLTATLSRLGKRDPEAADRTRPRTSRSRHETR